jgi:hypothetical protein
MFLVLLGHSDHSNPHGTNLNISFFLLSSFTSEASMLIVAKFSNAMYFKAYLRLVY